MLIILEGLDKCGKTTFANKFADIAEIIHCTKKDDMLAILQNAIKAADTGRLVILDRSFLSEMCYGPVYRGSSQITPAKLMKIKKLLSKTRYAILYFTRPEGEQQPYDSNDEFEQEPDKLLQVKKLYEYHITRYKKSFNIYEIQYK